MAQRTAQVFPKDKVAGSIPAGGAVANEARTTLTPVVAGSSPAVASERAGRSSGGRAPGQQQSSCALSPPMPHDATGCRSPAVYRVRRVQFPYAALRRTPGGLHSTRGFSAQSPCGGRSHRSRATGGDRHLEGRHTSSASCRRFWGHRGEAVPACLSRRRTPVQIRLVPPHRTLARSTFWNNEPSGHPLVDATMSEWRSGSASVSYAEGRWFNSSFRPECMGSHGGQPGAFGLGL